MKQKLDTSSDCLNGLEPPPKRIHTNEEEVAVNGMKAQQATLDTLDSDCAKEQMVIQQRYDSKKKPIFEQRQALIAKIPGFWGQAITKACDFHREPCHEDDKIILQFLDAVELDDNLDPNGSYRITFRFSDGVKDWLEPTVLKKWVKFTKSGPDYEEIIEENTEINWKEGKRPKRPTARIEDDEEPISYDDFVDESVLEWFSKDGKTSDFGEMIRRQVFHHPHTFYEMESEDELDDLDDEDDVDDDDEDVDAGDIPSTHD